MKFRIQRIPGVARPAKLSTFVIGFPNRLRSSNTVVAGVVQDDLIVGKLGYRQVACGAPAPRPHHQVGSGLPRRPEVAGQIGNALPRPPDDRLVEYVDNLVAAVGKRRDTGT